MTVHRFYAQDAVRVGLVLRLPTGEAHQLRRVLRLRPGAPTIVFDGQGHEFAARVDAAHREGVIIRTLEAREPVPEPAVRLTLAQAILKGPGTRCCRPRRDDAGHDSDSAHRHDPQPGIAQAHRL